MKFGIVITVIMTCSIGLSTLLSAQQNQYERGMQTARPQNSIDSRSPRTIDFTNPHAGRPVIEGNRQIPLQNLPFGDRRAENFEQFLDSSAEKKKKGMNLFENFPNPFKRNGEAKPFQFPSNMNRKPNYNNGQLLTDQKPNPFKIPNLFKPIPFEKPQWMVDMDRRTKEMFSFKNPMKGNGFGKWAQQASADWQQRNTEAWQKFQRNINPKNWGTPGLSNPVNPPIREANNWQGGLQNRRR